MKVENLIGKIYGDLKVLERDYSRVNRAYWICLCSCGKTISVSGTKLRNGQRSCGCKNSFVISPGDRFGKLVAVSQTENRASNGSIIWKCLCDCGTFCYVRKDNLKEGKTKSCGCLKKEQNCVNIFQSSTNLTGKKYGKLTVLEIDQEKNKNSTHCYWRCQCECGNIISARADHLVRYETASCGCSKQSAGEIIIQKILRQFNINFIQEYSFDNLKNVKPLRFDFAIFDQNNQELVCLIEFDGKQHYYENNFFTNSLEDNQKRDHLKNEYCIKNKIPLFRIPYNKIQQITNIKDMLSFEFLVKEI